MSGILAQLLYVVTCVIALASATVAQNVKEGTSSDFSLVVQASQGGYVQKILLDKAGRTMATVSSTGVIQIWDTVRRQEVWSFANLLWPNNHLAVALSPNGARLAVGGGSGLVHLVDLMTGSVSDIISGDSALITSVAFNPDSTLLTVGSAFGRVDMIDLSAPTKTANLYRPTLPDTREFARHTGADAVTFFRSVSAMLFQTTSNTLLVGLTTGDIYVLDLQLPNAVPRFVAHMDGMAVGFAVAGNELLGTSMTIDSSEVAVWSLSRQKRLVRFPGCQSQIDVPNIALSSTIAVATCFNDKTHVRTLNMLALPSGQSIAAPDGRRLEGILSPAALNEDGSVMAFAADSQSLRVWDTTSDMSASDMQQSSVHVIDNVSYSPQTAELIVSSGDDVFLWDTRQTTKVERLSVKDGQAAFSEDGVWMAYFDYRGRLVLYNRITKSVRETPVAEQSIFKIGVSQVGPTVFCINGGGFGGYARYWRWGENAAHIICSSDLRGRVAVSSQGRYSLIGCNHGTVGYTSAEAILYRNSDMKIVDTENSDLLTKTVVSSPTEAAGFFFSQDETIYGVNFLRQINVRHLDGKTELVIPSDLEHDRGFLGPMAMSLNQQLIAAEEFEFTLPGEHEIPGKSLSPEVGLIEASAGKSIGRSPLDAVASAMTFLPNYLAIGSVDGTTALLSIPSLSNKVTLVHPNGGWLVVAPDGAFDGTAEALRSVGWRPKGQRTIIPLDLLYDRYEVPDLFPRIVSSRYTPSKDTLANELGFGSLELMVQQGYVHIDPADSRYLCFSDPPTSPISLYSDGAPLSFTSGEIRRGSGRLCPWRAQLPSGASKIESRPNQIASASLGHCPAVQPATRLKIGQQGVLHVLTVAVSTYQPASRFPSLPSTVPSAIALERMFNEQPRGNGFIFRDIVIHPGLRDDGIVPTLENIRKAWRALIPAVQPEDTVVLFLSAHGLVPEGSQMFYFAPADFNSGSISTERDTGLNVAMLSDMLRELPARRIVLILDTCQSGAALTSLAKVSEVKQRIDEATGGRGHGGIYIVASATALQKAIALPSEDPSPLAQIVLQLASRQLGAKTASISAGELASDICQRLPRFTEQTPLVYSTGNNFPLLVRR